MRTWGKVAPLRILKEASRVERKKTQDDPSKPAAASKGGSKMYHSIQRNRHIEGERAHFRLREINERDYEQESGRTEVLLR